MPRLKVRCATCGKVFTPANAKQTLCPDCEKANRFTSWLSSKG
jgi:phage FluMu protein Com